MIFNGAAILLSRIAPVMLGNEFLFGSSNRVTRLAAGHKLDVIFLARQSPAIRHTVKLFGTDGQRFYPVAHWQRNVVFVVEIARDKRNRASGNQFSDENDASTPPVAGFATHVKPKIDFLKIGVERNGNAKHTSVQKQKTDGAHKGAAVALIKLGAGGN